MAEQLNVLLGPTGHWFFLIGFWCAVFTSMLGVWQGVPDLVSSHGKFTHFRSRLGHPRPAPVFQAPQSTLVRGSFAMGAAG